MQAACYAEADPHGAAGDDRDLAGEVDEVRKWDRVRWCGDGHPPTINGARAQRIRRLHWSREVVLRAVPANIACMDSETLAWILASGLATGLGGAGLLVLRRPAPSVQDALLGFTAGVMLAATAFSLLVPGLERGGVAEVLAGFGLGAAVMVVLDSSIPHAHERLSEDGHATLAEASASRRARLLLSALTIHNVPEGMAVGLAFAAGGTELGIPLALAIGIQNIPEGFAAAAPLLEAGVGRGKAALVALGTGVVEPPAALLAFATFEAAGALLPAGLGFAAGAMLYVVVDEIIPESHGRGNERLASVCLMAGFALLLALDNSFA